MPDGPDLVDYYDRVAFYIDHTFLGAKANNLFNHAPTKFVLATNQALRRRSVLRFCQHCLPGADEVINR
jgi:hypothetical protein